jgi:hypothetical protein
MLRGKFCMSHSRLKRKIAYSWRSFRNYFVTFAWRLCFRLGLYVCLSASMITEKLSHVLHQFNVIRDHLTHAKKVECDIVYSISHIESKFHFTPHTIFDVHPIECPNRSAGPFHSIPGSEYLQPPFRSSSESETSTDSRCSYL